MDSHDKNDYMNYQSQDSKPEEAIGSQRSPQLDKNKIRSHSRYGFGHGYEDNNKDSAAGHSHGDGDGQDLDNSLILPDAATYMSDGDSMVVGFANDNDIQSSSMSITTQTMSTTSSLRSGNTSAMLGFVGTTFESHALPNFIAPPMQLTHEPKLCLNMSFGNIDHGYHYPMDISIGPTSETGDEGTPSEAGGDEGLEDHKVEVGNVGLVSIREMYLAIARHRGCTCHGGVLPDADDYPFGGYE